METIIKHFNELSIDELFEILKLRVSIFVVEQNCPYQEIDDIDKSAYHLFLKNEEGIQAYLRIYEKNHEIRIGRVIAVKRRCGLGAKILQEGIKVAKEKLKANKIGLEAQVYAKQLYAKQGFKEVSDIFLEDGIPHIRMELECSKKG